MFINDKKISPICIPPKVGEVVTVIGESNIYEDHWYIQEYPVGRGNIKQSFAKYRFSPLSDICETELAKQRELQTA